MALRVSFFCLLLSEQALATPAAGLRGIAASGHPLATAAAVDILRQGGNAADAAAATAFTLAVVEPYSSGLGGGGFALVRMHKDLVFLDFREVGPSRATRDMFMKNGQANATLAQDGIFAAAVPGAAAGYFELHKRWGKLSRANVLAPAIAAATKGFVVDLRYQAFATERLPVLKNDPYTAAIFLVQGKDGYEVPPLGYRIVQKDLARTLESLASAGPDGFYKGKTAQQLLTDAHRRGGILEPQDLAGYHVRERAPLVGTFGEWTVATAPPPSAGGQVVLTLLRGLRDASAVGKTAVRNDVAYLHRYIELSKRAFADRHLIADPDFAKVPMAALLDPKRVERLIAGIGAKATPSLQIAPGMAADLPAGFVVPKIVATQESNDTTHFCVMDEQGDAVAMTTTINYIFGAGIAAQGTGVLWNDEMDDFAVAPGVANSYGIVGAEANAIAPGKTPVSSMSPTFVFGGETTAAPLVMVVGSPGGPRIPTTVVQTIANHLFFGMDVEQAVFAGRIHHQHLPDVVSMEAGALDPLTQQALQNLGHVFKPEADWSNASAIAVDLKTGVRTASADRRGVGAAQAQ